MTSPAITTIPQCTSPEADAPSLPGQTERGELERVLAAWDAATHRLQKTHEILRDEVRRLTDELEFKNRELARENRLADLGRMASHVAHEVRNGLAPVTLYLSLLRRRLVDDPVGLRIMDNIEAGCTALEATVNDLLSFTLDRDPLWRQFDVRPLVQEICDAFAPQISAQEIRTEISVTPGTRVWADRDMLRRALFNLVLNAIDAMPHGGHLIITACGGAGGLEIEVADSGPGIAEDIRPRIFEPFFTTKSEGTGLGLAIVYRVAEAHAGEVHVTNCPEGGAAFTLRIPPRATEAAA
jgi:signal transduction histidine kinase